MGGVVPIYSAAHWRNNPGSEMSMVPGDEAEFRETFGLAFEESTGQYISPRVDALARQKLSVQDLDEEELIRGQVRDADGKFRPGPTRKIPKEFHDELMRRILEHGTEKLRGEYFNAIDTLITIMNDTNTDDALRVKVATYIIERLGGKTPDRVDVSVTAKPYEQVMTRIIRQIPEELVQDAEVVDDEPEE